VKKKDWR